MDVLVIAAGIVPMLIYPFFVYWMDRYEKEPLHLLAAVFLWGFVPAAVLSITAELLFGMTILLVDETGQIGDMLTTVVAAPISEELFKGLAVLLVFLIWRDEFDGIFDGIIYGSLVGFGFAAIENILYFTEYGLGLFFLRAVLFGLNHAFFTSLTGIGFGASRHARSPAWGFLAPLLGLLAAISVHGLHNTIIMLAAQSEESLALLCFGIIADWGGVLVILIVMAAAIRQERHWIIDQLRDEVALGTLTQAQYSAASSPVGRLGLRFQSLFTGGLSLWRRTGRYFGILTKLAYKKHAYSCRNEASAELIRIDRLRSEARTLSDQLSGSLQWNQ